MKIISFIITPNMAQIFIQTLKNLNNRLDFYQNFAQIKIMSIYLDKFINYPYIFIVFLDLSYYFMIFSKNNLYLLFITFYIESC